MLASLRGQLFSDDDFAEIYGPDNGRDSVPPSLLATALLLQTYDKVSDAEAKARADFDIRWKVALGIEIEDRPFAKSTLQMFRAQLILHDQVREVFEGSLRLARQSGYLKKRGMRVALDTTYILGRGAVKDTYNRNCSELRGSPAFPTSCGRVAKHRICFASRLVPSNVNCYLQSAGGRDRQTVACPGCRGEHRGRGMGRRSGLREVLRVQHQGRGDD